MILLRTATDAEVETSFMCRILRVVSLIREATSRILMVDTSRDMVDSHLCRVGPRGSAHPCRASQIRVSVPLCRASVLQCREGSLQCRASVPQCRADLRAKVRDSVLLCRVSVLQCKASVLRCRDNHLCREGVLRCREASNLIIPSLLLERGHSKEGVKSSRSSLLLIL